MLQQLPAEAKPLLPKGEPVDRETLAQAIQSGWVQPIQGQEFRFGVLLPNGQIKTHDPIFRKIATYLRDRLPEGAIPETGLTFVVRERGQDTFPAVEKFLEEKVIPHFQVEGRLPVLDAKQRKRSVEVLQTVAWPFFQQVIAGVSLSSEYEALAKEMGALPLFDLQAASEPGLNQLMRETFQPVKQRLSGLETATMQYSDRAHVREVLASMLTGAAIGSTGELLIHHYLDGGTAMAAVARTGTLVLVDTIDGVFGEMGVLRDDLRASGIDFSVKSLYGNNPEGTPKTWWQILRRPFAWQGRAKMFAQRASMSAIKGAAAGTILSAPAGVVLSDPMATIAHRSLAGAAGTLGTATSIPFNFRATFPQVYLATRMLMAQGKIPVPEAIQKDEKALQRYAMEIARQDLVSRLGFAASMKAYAMAPLSGVILLSEAIGVPREVAQTIFMGMAPAMENLLRLCLTLNRLKRTNPKNMAKAEQLVLDAAGRPFDAAETARLENLFADRIGKSIAWTLTQLPPTLKMPVLELPIPTTQASSQSEPKQLAAVDAERPPDPPLAF
jgi:hypothetical protein